MVVEHAVTTIPLPALAARPHHVAIIMDGNGRWAEARNQPRQEGHRAGSKSVRRIVRLARRIGLDALTLYAFSFQNWERPEDEVEALMALLHDYLDSERNEILDNDIRLEAIGELHRLPTAVREVLDRLRAESAGNGKMTLTLALSYGGQEEIANVVRSIVDDALAGKITRDAVDAELIKRRLPSLRVGDPDLIIRTGGEKRLSNFLLYGSAYAELFFSQRLWPDFCEDDLFAAIASFQRRERRFGLVEPPRAASSA